MKCAGFTQSWGPPTSVVIEQFAPTGARGSRDRGESDNRQYIHHSKRSGRWTVDARRGESETQRSRRD